MNTNKLERDLVKVKLDAAKIPLRRREIMYRLYNDANFTYQQIADIYMCRRQYVEQEVAAYKSQDVSKSKQVS